MSDLREKNNASPETEEPKKKKRSRAAESKGLAGAFARLFGKYDLRDEEQFVALGKGLIFIVLIIVEIFIILHQFEQFPPRGGWTTFGMILIAEIALTLCEWLKLFVVKNLKGRAVLYVLEAIAASFFIFVTDSFYPISIFILVLTEFYIGTKKTRPSVVLLIVAVLLYAGCYVARGYALYEGNVDLYEILTQSFGSLFTLVVHFMVVRIGLAFYRQFLQLQNALAELDESKKELEKAYEVVAEVTALEERQRIAKEIHDTAGHSLTTVIMQTEAAKLIVTNNPEEAKSKIVAANLQAKHALEELRDSVHLLSGINADQTLKTALEGIIHESTDGTGITIRSEIADVAVYPAKFRFLCNTLKEGISNGLRHGGATAFWFELKTDGDKIEFLLSDNGKGVEEKDLVEGFGLTSMKDRAKALGGEVHIQSEAGEGFELRLTLPTDGAV